MNVQTPVVPKLVIHGAFECKDKDGNVLKVIQIRSEIPVSDAEVAELSAQLPISQE